MNETLKTILMLSLVAATVALGACGGGEYGEAEDAAATGDTEAADTEAYAAEETAPAGAEQTAAVAETDTLDWGAYDEWDADANAELTREEFDEGLQGTWDWDVDGDGVAGPDEMSDNFWDLFDGNQDNLIDETEWAQGQERFEAGAEWGNFADFDTDGDGHLGRTEYDDWFNESAWDGVWDTDDDGVVGRDEVADTFWDWFDLNDDNLVDQTEFEQTRS